jgi:hypothetical protein
MGVFDDIPVWARLPDKVEVVPKKRGRPPGAKDSKPRKPAAPVKRDEK